MSHIKKCKKKNLIDCPDFVNNQLQYECIMGSNAYGVSSDNSDLDIYGFCIPNKDIIFRPNFINGFDVERKFFEQYQQHHITYSDKIEYDFSIYNITKFFRLVMDNNPNMIDSLFSPLRCITYITPIGQLVRDNRHIFLSKKAYHKLRGYAFSQLHKMDIKEPNPNSKRYESIMKYGMDCYLEKETEFLTENGWKKFDEVDSKIATLNIKNGNVEFQSHINKIDKSYTGEIYILEPYMNRCVVTKNHNMLVSNAHRSKYGYEYIENESNWTLKSFNSLLEDKKRSWYHIRTCANFRTKEYDVSDDYLSLSGLYVSEGSITFRNGKIRNVRLSQTKNGKKEFFNEIRRLSKKIDIKEYNYEKETIWVINKELSKKIYNDYGYGCRYNLKLPKWCFKLSFRQSMIFWKSLFYGDGSKTKNGEVIYTSNKQLADDYQAMMISSGYQCSVRGPFLSKTSFGDGVSYQVYLSKEKKFKCVDFSKGVRFLPYNKNPINKKGYPIKEKFVKNERVVCFEVPNGTLITRSNGKTSFHGNCKFAYHVVRLIDECFQILNEHDLDIERNREQLKSIRRGEWTKEDIRDYFQRNEKLLQEAYQDSTLPYSPDEDAIRQLLITCLKKHFGDSIFENKKIELTNNIINDIDCVLEKYR